MIVLNCRQCKNCAQQQFFQVSQNLNFRHISTSIGEKRLWRWVYKKFQSFFSKLKTRYIWLRVCCQVWQVRGDPLLVRATDRGNDFKLLARKKQSCQSGCCKQCLKFSKMQMSNQSLGLGHTWYLSRTPQTYSCKIFWPV